MKKCVLSAVDFLFVLLLALVLTVPQNAFAQNHVVTSTDLQKDMAGTSTSRGKDLAQLENFLSSPEARHTMKSAHMDYQQVKSAVGQLNDEDLARLSARSEKAQRDFAAGRLADRDLLIILVAVAALILIIVAVR
jgi:hypothetical protein